MLRGRAALGRSRAGKPSISLRLPVVWLFSRARSVHYGGRSPRDNVDDLRTKEDWTAWFSLLKRNNSAYVLRMPLPVCACAWRSRSAALFVLGGTYSLW
jgi:hypothetical protein